jgi:hypothetical protein
MRSCHDFFYAFLDLFNFFALLEIFQGRLGRGAFFDGICRFDEPPLNGSGTRDGHGRISAIRDPQILYDFHQLLPVSRKKRVVGKFFEQIDDFSHGVGPQIETAQFRFRGDRFFSFDFLGNDPFDFRIEPHSQGGGDSLDQAPNGFAPYPHRFRFLDFFRKFVSLCRELRHFLEIRLGNQASRIGFPEGREYFVDTVGFRMLDKPDELFRLFRRYFARNQVVADALERFAAPDVFLIEYLFGVDFDGLLEIFQDFSARIFRFQDFLGLGRMGDIPVGSIAFHLVDFPMHPEGRQEFEVFEIFVIEF